MTEKSWASLKKRKQRRTNENISMREEVKVRHADEAIGIVSSGNKIESREEKGFVTSAKIWELDGNNVHGC